MSRQSISGIKLRHSQFILIQCNRFVIPIQVTVITQQKTTCHAPGLCFIITDIFDLQSDFFHYFTLNSLFHCFPDFRKTGDHTIAGIVTVGIFAQEQSVPMSHPNDNRRCDFGKNHVIAFRTAHHTFLAVMHRLCTASAAETVASVPVKQVPRCHDAKSNVFGDHLTKCHRRFISVRGVPAFAAFSPPDEIIHILQTEYILGFVFIPAFPVIHCRPRQHILIGRQLQFIISISVYQCCISSKANHNILISGINIAKFIFQSAIIQIL